MQRLECYSVLTETKDCGLGSACVKSLWQRETALVRAHVYARVLVWGLFSAATLLCEDLSL